MLARHGARQLGHCQQPVPPSAQRGAVPDDHDLYPACFGGDGHESLRPLLAQSPDVSQATALSAPVSTRDTQAVRMLLEAEANPNRLLPRDDSEPPAPRNWLTSR